MTRSLATSSDGQWAIYRDGRDVLAFAAGSAPPLGQTRLAGDDDALELAVAGPPTAVVSIARTPSATELALLQPPYLESVATLTLDAPMRLAAITGQRVVLVGADHKRVEVVRAAGRSLAHASFDPGGPLELAVGLERNQLLFGMPKKLEVWDAVSGRPVLRLQLQLPPPPRQIGTAAGHLWVTRPGSDEVFVYRLSDGRPFRHYVGSPVSDVISHPASPLVVLVTPRGLVRLHCFAHSVAMIDVPAEIAAASVMAQLVVGEDASLIGLARGSAEPWHVAIQGAGAPTTPVEPLVDPDEELHQPPPPPTTAADRLKSMRESRPEPREPAPEPLRVEPAREIPLRPATSAGSGRVRPSTSNGAHVRWREPLVNYAHELIRGVDGDLPVVSLDSELGALAQRVALSSPARRALIALYALYLVGEPALPIARLAKALGGDWTEALGNGELGALAMLRRTDGRVALRPTVTDLLDGHPPRARLLGDDLGSPAPGVARLARRGRRDDAIERELAQRLGRLAITPGDDARTAGAVLEARLHGATAVALAPPRRAPQPLPRDAALVVITADTAGPAVAWIDALPVLED